MKRLLRLLGIVTLREHLAEVQRQERIAAKWRHGIETWKRRCRAVERERNRLEKAMPKDLLAELRTGKGRGA